MKPYGWTILFVVLIGGYVAAEVVAHRRAEPGDRADKLGEFLTWQSTTDDFARLHANGKQHIIAFGPAGRMFPSGPAAYVFDETGSLVDWSNDIGDDSRFDDKWQAQRAYGGDSTIPRFEVRHWHETRPASMRRDELQLYSRR